MRKIFGIGRTVLDIIFKDNQPLTAKPGGSVLNSMVSMGRVGLPVSFISEYGLDSVGNLINDFLKDNGVDTSSVNRYHDGSTALALAFLDYQNEAHYSFYKDFPGKRLDMEFPLINKNDIIQCGSAYAIMTEIRDKFICFIDRAKEKDALIFYDPNFRKTHISELKRLKPHIIENFRKADIIRASNEDFMNIFNISNPDDAWELTREYCECLIYTANLEGIYVRTRSFTGEFPVKKIIPVSTIGAGDNFNAGMITSIYRNGYDKGDLVGLSGKNWEEVISVAVDFATHVCLSYDNYISTTFADSLKG